MSSKTLDILGESAEGSNAQRKYVPSIHRHQSPILRTSSPLASSHSARHRSPNATPSGNSQIEHGEAYELSEATSQQLQEIPRPLPSDLEKRLSLDDPDPDSRVISRNVNVSTAQVLPVGPREFNGRRARSEVTEDRDVKRVLGIWDVAALITNKIIGTGFFTTVGQVLLLTGDKRISLGLWVVGGVYSMISFSIYLEYGHRFPFNGADLIYLDRVYSLWPPLATVVYSIFFICFANTTGNTLAFARHCIAAAVSDVDNFQELDKRLVSLIAVSILTVVCLLLYFSRETSRAVNRLLMWYKFGLFLTIFIAGALARNHPGSGLHDWKVHHDATALDGLSAAIYVIYSFEGWENANYVTGEIKDVGQGTLKWGGFLAITLTTLSYILGTIGYYWACDFETITSKQSDLGMGHYFAQRAFGHTTGFKICIALSAAGNLVAVIYTFSTVKQTIALQQFIPFYKFIGTTDMHFSTPGGALLLQWLVTLPFILATPNSTDGYSFMLGIYSYIHLFVLVMIGLGILVFEREWIKNRKLRMQYDTRHGEFRFLVWPPIRYVLVLSFVGLNGLILGVSATPHKNGIPRYIWPLMGLVIFGVGLLYYFILRSLINDGFLSKWTGVQATVMNISTDGTITTTPTHRLDNERPPRGFIELTKFDELSQPGSRIDSCRVQDLREEYRQMMTEASLDGSQRRVLWDIREGHVKTVRTFIGNCRDVLITIL